MEFEGIMPFLVRCVVTAGVYAVACWLGWAIA